MDEAKSERFHLLLATERASTLHRLRSLQADVTQIVEASEGSNADDEHDPEGATIAFERAQTSALAASAEAHLEEIAAAEERLALGTYGLCEVCEQPIAEGRLEARPTARRCIRHA
jgi:DnaK suppressor protein